jgi:hypothetical protein
LVESRLSTGQSKTPPHAFGFSADLLPRNQGQSIHVSCLTATQSRTSLTTVTLAISHFRTPAAPKQAFGKPRKRGIRDGFDRSDVDGLPHFSHLICAPPPWMIIR